MDRAGGRTTDRYRRRTVEEGRSGDPPIAEVLAEVLSTARELLGVENAHVTWVDDATGVQTVVHATGRDAVPAGREYDHVREPCRQAIDRDSPVIVAVDGPDGEGWRYLGCRVTVDDALYGTVCFVDRGETAFSEADRSLAALVARALGGEFAARRRGRQVADRDRLLDTMDRVLRHDVRNGMDAVGGFAELLADRLDDEGAAMAERIVDRADALVSLCETTRLIESLGRDPPPPVPRDLGAVAESVATDLRALVESDRVTVDTPEAPRALCSPQVDAALYHLGTNAVVHGSGTVEIAVERDDEWVTVAVHDDGPGLPDHERALLTGESATQLAHGSGLGLRLVYWVATHSGGRVEVGAEDGTTVTLSFPAV